jgi:hypothetical protein
MLSKLGEFKNLMQQMKEDLDSVTIELKVIAVQMGLDIWMQAQLEILINGTKPYFESDIINSEILLKSIESDGEYYIFSCNCGVPECSGWIKGINVTHQGRKTKWIDFNSDRIWYLDRDKMENDLKIIQEEVKLFKQYFDKKQIEYVGVGYNW